jgi:peptide chain release factor subunit 1
MAITIFQDLARLQSLPESGPPILSLYLYLRPAHRVEKAYRTVAKDLLKDLEARLSETDRALLEPEAQRVREYLQEVEPKGKGLALFASQPRNLWVIFNLPTPVPDYATFESTPYLRPLLAALDEHEQYGVLVVDKRRSRLFRVFLDQIAEEGHHKDYVLSKHDQGGWSQANYQRHHEAHVHWHLKHAMDLLLAVHRQQPFDRIILAGTEEPLSELRTLVPKGLRDRIVGTFHIDGDAPESVILERVLAIEQEVERRQEVQLVEDLINTARAGGLASVEPEEVLLAVADGCVHRLVLVEGLSQPGFECSTCGALWLRPDLSQCPRCEQPVHAHPDVIERAIERTLLADGRVEAVQGPAAELLRREGGLGAILRFRLPVTVPAAGETTPMT